MDFKSYLTESQTVDIMIAKLGNQRITKSILNQMPEGFRINTDFDFGSIKILGYIKDKEEWIIYTENNIAYKNSLRNINELLNLLASQTTVSAISNFIEIDNWDEYNKNDRLGVLPTEKQKEFAALREKTARFYNIMKSHQIYI